MINVNYKKNMYKLTIKFQFSYQYIYIYIYYSNKKIIKIIEWRG